MKKLLSVGIFVLIFSIECSNSILAQTNQIWFKDMGYISSREVDGVPANIGMLLVDMDGDGDLDIVSAKKYSVKYFENIGKNKFLTKFEDKGKIISSHRQIYNIAVGDVSGDGIKDIIISTPEGMKIFKNLIPQK